MKTLYLIRHAKSSRDEDCDDFERPLTRRGETDAAFMAKRLMSGRVVPCVMLSSPAARALGTCLLFAKELEYQEKRILTDDRLYEAGAADLLTAVRGLSDTFKVALLFGHNPGVTDFAKLLVGDGGIGELPTCGVCRLELRVHSWAELNAGDGELVDFDYPKRHPERR